MAPEPAAAPLAGEESEVKESAPVAAADVAQTVRVSTGKLDFLIAEHGEAVSVMRAIKQALDPDNIMNPGKILRV